MVKIDKEVFIQNLEDCTTVLQQLEVCKKMILEIIDIINEEDEQ